ncbi:MAG: MarR family winged helix-turn-helix transcriptional regulator [Lawsonibacter sp.]
MKEVKISDIMQGLTKKIDAVYRHGTLQERYSAIPRDYGDGFILTESEAHTLGYVCEMGETTVTDLAEYSFRTKGTASKMLKKLEDKGLVQRTKRDGNRKWIYVSPTEQGLRANQIHQAYDRAATSVMMEELLKVCTMEDIESFYKVTQARIYYLSEKHKNFSQ